MPKRLELGELEVLFRNMVSALQKIQAKRYRVAMSLLDQVLRLNPFYANASFLYYICLENLQARKSLAEEFRKRAEQLNSFYYKNNDNKKQLIMANMKSILSDVEKRFPLVQTGIHKDWVYLLDVPLKKHDFNTALIVSQIFQISQNPNKHRNKLFSDETWSNIGVKYFQLGFYQKSIQMHLIAVQISPNDVMYYSNLATLSYSIGEDKKSQEYLNKTFQLESNRIKSFYIQSFIFQREGKIEEALENAKKAYKMQSEQTPFLIKVIIIMLLHYTQNTNEIKSLIKQALLNMQKRKFSRYYFPTKQNLPDFIRFINDHFEKLGASQNFKQYLHLLNDYLILGLFQKVKIKQQLYSLKDLILCQLNTSQQHQSKQHGIQQIKTQL